MEKKDIRKDASIEKHADWVEGFLPKYGDVAREDVMDILHKEIALVFSKVLEHAGVFKRGEEGQKAFDRFLSSLNE